jgi:hypothetical protein
MSTKTIKQRIAVVAVSALTAGLFSVVSAPASNAAVGGATVQADNNLATNTSTNPRLSHYDRLFVATMPTGTGSGVALTAVSGSDGTPDAAAGGGPATSSARSLGLVNVSDIAGGVSAGTTQTAVLLSTGSLSLYTATRAGEFSALTVTGGTFVSSTGTSMNATSTLVSGGGAAIATFGVVAKPSAGSTQMIVRLFTGNASIAAANLGLGDLEGQITVTIASASTAGAISPTYTALYLAASGTDDSRTSNAAASNASRTYGSGAFVNARIRDAYQTEIQTASAGVLSASATNGALVKLASATESDPGSSAGTVSTDFVSTTAPDDWMVRIDAPSTAPVSTVVTVSFNGTVIGTQSLVFTGEVAKVTLASPVIGKIGGSSNAAYYRLYDAAGNAVFNGVTSGAVDAKYPEGSLINDPSVNAGGKASAVTRSVPNTISSTGVITAGKVFFTCSSTAGAGTIGVTYTNPSGSVVKSNALAVTCADAAFTYAASWDKATYIPGDLAKLTITFKDSKGNLANDVDTIGDTNAQDTPSVAIGGLDRTITGPVSSDTLSDGGTISYTYTVGATEGQYSGKVTFPVVDRRQVAAGASAAVAVPITLVVKSATTTVTNADVLKSIVSLIASINKQIQALQKLILRR